MQTLLPACRLPGGGGDHTHTHTHGAAHSGPENGPPSPPPHAGPAIPAPPAKALRAPRLEEAGHECHRAEVTWLLGRTVPPFTGRSGWPLGALPPIGGNGCCPGSTCKHSVWQAWARAAGSLRLTWPLLFQTRICSLRGKKMDGTQNFNIQNMDVDQSPTSQETDKDDNGDVNELAGELVKTAIHAAVKSMEEAEKPMKSIKWITHGEFTAERGRKQIEEFVLTWEYQDRWVHYTQFIEREDLIHSYHYIYCVRWSTPTAKRPMPPVTASAFFTIKITKNKPPVSSSFSPPFA
ncbi:A-kinase anchor protein 14 [Meles meles]|uniref:A-kinase anchor protein 14 n=1 Tax=Meles meles TaxID=9662 RepID=UPI001E698FB1|nr:A-kinase anchor protein 14 [Meles meles]